MALNETVRWSRAM